MPLSMTDRRHGLGAVLWECMGQCKVKRACTSVGTVAEAGQCAEANNGQASVHGLGKCKVHEHA